MTRFAKYLILIIALFYWSISHFETLYSWAGKNRIYPDDYRYGDLYRLSFLPEFKEKKEVCEDKIDQSTIKNKVHLYLLGDSFTDESNLNVNNFEVEQYNYIHWDRPQTVELDNHAKNILILQSVERSLKLHFVKQSDELEIKSKANSIKQNTHKSILEYAENWVNTFSKNTKNTEERIWHTLLNYDFVLFFKELKASFDLKLFDRKSTNYNLSADKKQIFYFEEADINCPNSAFYKVSDTEIKAFVDIINNDLEHYKNMGFEEVYLALIPNKVSILDPTLGKYNHVLERVQTHPDLKIKVIDIYTQFKKETRPLFSKSDTHWNCYGSSIWQAEVNAEIQRYK
ncbi:MAG: hypothetical protein V4683_12830 [Bacteroidota bacterium]